jgi:hypothetical protein
MDKEELQRRIKNAIILLSDEHWMRVGDLIFGCRDKEHFSVIGYTRTIDDRCITRASASIELNEIKVLFAKMLTASKELSEFISNRQIEYSLNIDYGNGQRQICEEVNGNLKWKIESIK